MKLNKQLNTRRQSMLIFMYFKSGTWFDIRTAEAKFDMIRKTFTRYLKDYCFVTNKTYTVENNIIRFKSLDK